MQTVSFYSYKGGVGRTLAVANVAKYLAMLGQNVFVIDFDLEAPGMHYKLGLGSLSDSAPEVKGVVDYIHSFVFDQEIPDTFCEYTLRVDVEDSEGTITLMPAGNAPSSDYWQKLGQIDWHDFFYSEDARGIPFFLEFKEKIRQEFEPDFILLDSRTGITELGGIATSLLPDQVVCLLLNNQEHLEGSRVVMRSILRSPRLPDQQPIQIIPILARIPHLKSSEEEGLTQKVLSFLNEESEELDTTLELSEISILHSEPQLQVSEFLLVGSQKIDESSLLKDYIKLSTNFLSKDTVASHVGPLIESLRNMAWEDSKRAREGLETLVKVYPSTQTYKALIQFYSISRESSNHILHTAEQLWGISGTLEGDFLWKTIQENFTNLPYISDAPYSLEFIESIWRYKGKKQYQIGVKLARTHNTNGRQEKAVDIYLEILNQKLSEEIIVEVVKILMKLNRDEDAFDTLLKYGIGFLESNSQLRSAYDQLSNTQGHFTK